MLTANYDNDNHFEIGFAAGIRIGIVKGQTGGLEWAVGNAQLGWRVGGVCVCRHTFLVPISSSSILEK